MIPKRCAAARRTANPDRLSAWLLACLLAAGAAQALPVPGSVVPPPANAGLLRLGNGLEVLLLRIPDAPMTGLTVQVKAGSALESARTSGMAHLLEHLLFNGTERWSQQELYAAADRIGAYNNANTTRFYTNFMVLAPGADLQAAMEIQTQMLFHSLLPADKYAKERGIVLEELAQAADDPATSLERLWEDFLYAGSCAELPVLGTAATIRHLDRDSVHEYYRTWYRPNNMLLAVVGGFEPDSARVWVERHYGGVAPGELPAVEPAGLQWRPGEVRSRRGAVKVPRLRLAWPAPPVGSPEALAAELLAWAAGDPRDGVLPMLVFSAGLPPLSGLSFAYHGEPGLEHYELAADLPLGADPAETIAALARALAGLAGHPFDREAVAQRILDERSSMAQLMEKPHYFGLMQAGRFVAEGFERALDRPRILARLDPQELQAAAAPWLTENEPMALVIFPEAPRTGGGETAAATRLRRPGEGAGPDLVIQGGGSSQVFALQVLVRGRSVWEGPGRAGGIDAIHRLLEEGAAGQGAPELRQRLRRMGGKLTLHDDPRIPYDDHYTTSGHSFLRLEALGEHWEAACSLAVQLLMEPALRPEDLEKARPRWIAQLEREEASARRLSRDLLDSLLLGGRPAALKPAGTPASLAALEAGDLRRLHELAFRPENLVVSAVGPAPAEEVADLLGALFAPYARPQGPDEAALDWFREHSPWADEALRQSGNGPLRPPRLPLPAGQGPVELRRQLGGEMAAIRLGSGFAIEPEDRAPLTLLFALISERMSFELREERGWAYSIGCWLSADDEYAVAEAYMGTRPENLDAALAGVERHLQGRGLKGLDQDELDTVRGGLLGRNLMRGLASINQAWLSALGELEGDPDLRRRRLDELRSVRLEDLTRVRARYLKDRPWMTVVVE
jgi:zinc protease